MCAAATFRPAADEVFIAPVVAIASTTSASNWISAYTTNSTYIGSALPKNVALMTLRRLNGQSVVVNVCRGWAAGVTHSGWVAVGGGGGHHSA